MTTLETLLLLNRIPGCDARKVQILMDAVGDVCDLLREECLHIISKTTPFGKRLVHSIRTIQQTFDSAKELDELKSQAINVITFLDPDYPVNLLAIHDPPVLLYVKGDIIPTDALSISIVGSRNASFYGRTMASELAFELAERQITVVSGMALGIDSAAHQGALRAGGRTIAVLGSGIDVVYPPKNKQLYADISHHGAVITEFPLHTQPFYYNFPRRNRIISGLSKGTVVVEAACRSGSLITARLALEEGREVYSIPGNANSVRSQGTNQLIKEGAKLVTSAAEILADLMPMLEHKETSHCKGELHFAPTDVITPTEPVLSPEEEIVFSSLRTEPQHVDELKYNANIDASRLLSILTQLEVMHKAKRVSGSRYVKVGSA